MTQPRGDLGHASSQADADLQSAFVTSGSGFPQLQLHSFAYLGCQAIHFPLGHSWAFAGERVALRM